MRRDRNGQSALEYVLLVVGSVGATIALSLYLQYAVGARTKSSAEALSQLPANPDRVDVAFVNCQEYYETQTARSGPGHLVTRFAEASQQRTSNPTPVARFTACPQIPAMPVVAP